LSFSILIEHKTDCQYAQHIWLHFSNILRHDILGHLIYAV